MVRSFLLTLGLSALIAAAQTVRVEGSVVSQSGAAVAKANVVLWGATKYTEFSDENGKFALNAAPGVYSLFVTGAGFVTQKYGSNWPLEDSCDVDQAFRVQRECLQRAPGTTLSLEPGQDLEDLKVTLNPLGVITGRVSNASGDPAGGWIVLLWCPIYGPGGPTLLPLHGATAGADGAFRISNVDPGRYFMSAQGNGRPPSRKGPLGPEADVRTFYPSEMDTEISHAVRLDVAAGAELRGMDIRVRTSHLYSVGGTFVADAETEGASLPITLNRVGGPPDRGGFSVRPSFQLTDVTPGEYDLRAGTVGSNLPQRCLRARLTVTDSNVDGFALPLEPCVQIAGNIRFEGERAEAQPRIRLVDSEVPKYSQYGDANPEGSFWVPNLARTTYFVDIDGFPEGAYVKSARAGGQDVIHSLLDVKGDSALDVVISTHGATLTATVKNERDEPMPGVGVTIWPAIARAGVSTGGIQTGRSDQHGNLSFLGLAPEEYFVIAWPDVSTERGLLEYRPFITGFRPEATSVTVVEDAKVNAVLKPISREKMTAEIAKLP